MLLLRLTDHSLVDDLCHHFSRSGFQAESFGGGMVGVAHADSADSDTERAVILAHLTIWRIANADAEVDAIDPA